MLLDANRVESFLQTNGKGKKAQVGYDLTLKSINKVNGGFVMKDKTTINEYTKINTTLSNSGKNIYVLEAGTYSLTFEQGCKLDSCHTAFIRHRSSVLRAGGIITSGVYDPGFEVEEMGAMLIATQTITIEQGARVAQIIMMKNYESELYDGQFQSNKDIK
jgi:deoxycytidine triphosphate deaminase